MQQTVKITALLQNPSGVWEDQSTVELPDGMPPHLAGMAVLKQLQNAGGLCRATAGKLTYIPWHRVVTVDVEFSGVVIADALEAAAATRQVPQGLIKSA